MKEPFDLIIIGAGSAGLTAADFAAKLGARVALIEKKQIGGDCTWVGCVPSKALLKAAKMAHAVKKAPDYGVCVQSNGVDMRRVRETIRQTVQTIHQQELAQLRSQPLIELVQGSARFLDPFTISVGERELSGKNFIIATGAHPSPPPVPGYSEAPCVTYEQLFDNELLPKRLVILGAGATGMEMAQAYGRLGASVTIIDISLLPTLDPEVGAVMEQVFEREGIEYVAGLAASITYETGQFEITLNNEARQKITADYLLTATGRHPNVAGLDLEKAGIVYDAQGIQVNDNLRTSIKNIYAAGDCTGGFQMTHYAGWQGYKAVRNIMLPGSDRGVRRFVPYAIYTDPEIAHVGMSETEARAEYGNNVNVARQAFDQVDRAIIEGELEGFVKIVYKNNGALLGATIVAPRAGEMISEFVLALNHGLTVNDLAQAMHVYPAYGMGVQQLAGDVSMEMFLSSTVGRIALRISGFKVL